MQNKRNDFNSRNRSNFDGPSDVIINCKSTGKFMDFRNASVHQRADPGKSAAGTS